MIDLLTMRTVGELLTLIDQERSSNNTHELRAINDVTPTIDDVTMYSVGASTKYDVAIILNTDRHITMYIAIDKAVMVKGIVSIEIPIRKRRYRELVEVIIYRLSTEFLRTYSDVDVTYKINVVKALKRLIEQLNNLGKGLTPGEPFSSLTQIHLGVGGEFCAVEGDRTIVEFDYGDIPARFIWTDTTLKGVYNDIETISIDTSASQHEFVIKYVPALKSLQIALEHFTNAVTK